MGPYTLTDQLTGLGLFLSYFLLASVLTAAYLRIYTWMTPHNELKLIRSGVTAASVALGGSLIGFCLALASAITNSVGLIDYVIWGVVALIIQVGVYKGLHLAIADVGKRLEAGDMAAGILVASASIAAGVLNAACMTY